MNVKNIEVLTDDFSLEMESDGEQGIVHFVIREFTKLYDEKGEVDGVIENNATGLVLLLEQLEELQIAINDAILHQKRAEGSL